ncbi:hypothetical protein YTPLAS21_19010 [Candidatus Nitrosocosmicus sp.]|nr:hypothetical protein YTPLAS21_19010 [Candidatus Nitrosocosmicus sp.]
MATNNQINKGLSGSSGTGNFASSTDEEFTTPILGAATGSTLTYNDYAAGGIVGVTTNNNADAGVVGEFQEDTESVGVACVDDTPLDICSIALSAGDWDISGNAYFNFDATATGDSITVTLNTTSATLPTIGTENNYVSFITSISSSVDPGLCVGQMRLSISGATTIYLVGQVSFAGGTVTAYGNLQARRVR